MMMIETGLSEGQVLQRLGSRGANARIAGSAKETGDVLATLSGRGGILSGWKSECVGSAKGGRFSAELRNVPAGGPYRLTLQVGKAKVTREFFVGDVWLMAGQSNMQGIGDMTQPGRTHPLIRVFSMRREWRLAADPLHLLPESPDACHSAGRPCTPQEGEALRRASKKGVGMGLFFGHEMLRHREVPVGLIATAHGGTSMEQWNPALRDKGGDSLYGSMLTSLRATGQPIAGVLWYQGENDALPVHAPHYTTRMINLVAAVRSDLRQPQLPWIVVQLARVYGDNDAVNWNSVQDQQRLLPEKIRLLETVAAIDLPLDDGVHIGAAGFPRLGVRVAYAAQALARAGEKRPPQLKAVVPVKNETTSAGPCVDVFFDAVKDGLRSDGPPQGFALVDAKGRNVPIIYRTELKRNAVRLHCCRPLQPELLLSYGHGLAPVCTITDGRDFSLPVFGPIPLFKPAAYLPFVTTWLYSGIVEAKQPLGKIACPDLQKLGGSVEDYGASAGFINEHAAWQGRSGQAYFGAKMRLSETMTLRFLMGYDGPFRMWVDGNPFFSDLEGTNPCFADQSEKRASFPAGEHQITVAMDLAGGQAWGFMLRSIREDVSARQIETLEYRTPKFFA